MAIPVRPGTRTTHGQSEARQPENQIGTSFADPIRASSLSWLHQQAGQKTAPDQCAETSKLPLATREPSTEDRPQSAPTLPFGGTDDGKF
jgi:hypothetical protein